jgi:hypothetical protein
MTKRQEKDEIATASLSGSLAMTAREIVIARSEATKQSRFANRRIANRVGETNLGLIFFLPKIWELF